MNIKEVQKTIKWLREKMKEMNLTPKENETVMSFLAEIWMDETSKAVENLQLPIGTIIRHNYDDCYGGFSEFMMAVENHQTEFVAITTGGEVKTIKKLEYLLGDYREEMLK